MNTSKMDRLRFLKAIRVIKETSEFPSRANIEIRLFLSVDLREKAFGFLEKPTI
jgi:hypothetical protein